MSVAGADVRAGGARRVLFLDRVLAATPLLALTAWLALLYAVEAFAQKSPTIFTDELQWTQFSRSVAEQGVASIRGERVWFESLYVYVVAPVWWLKDTATSYEALKYVNVVLMTSAAFPAYLLSRRLVSKPAALAVAVASIAIPPMVYALYVVTEVVAYPWAVLCAWLIAEALAVRSRGWVAAAGAAAALAPLVRGQLVVIPVAFAVAAFAVWWLGPRARRLRGSSWVSADTVGLALLGVGAIAVLSRWLLHSHTVWRLPTDAVPMQIGWHALWAAGALTIGIGVLPLVAGLTGLVPRRGEPLSAHDRAFIALTVSFLGSFAAYTGLKGAYNMLTFADRIDERNFFYVAPMLLLGTAIALERRRVRLLPLALAAGLAAFVIAATPIQLNYPYFDAPGFSIAAMANRVFYWPTETIQTALYVTLGISVALILAVRVARGALARAGLAVVALLVVAWSLTGQVTAAGGANETSRTYAANLPQPRDWIERATGGAHVTYLGQAITSGAGLRTNLLEFWNPSIVNVWTTDHSLLFPGRTLTPRLVKADGTLSNPPGTPFLLADSGIHPVGSAVESRGDLRLYPLDGPIRLRESVEGVDEEAWMGSFSAYNRHAEAAGGELVVSLSLTAFCPDRSVAPPAPVVTVTVGSLVLGMRDEQPAPLLADEWTSRTSTVPICERREVRLPVRRAPWRAEVRVDRTFQPADYGMPDTRTLGVMVGFRHDPAGG